MTSHHVRLTSRCVIGFAFQTCKQRDAALIQRAVSVLRKLESDSVYQDTVLHLIVSHLCSNPDLFATPEFCQTVLVQYLLVTN